MRRWMLLVAMIAVAMPVAMAGQTLTYVDLVDRLTNLQHLSVPPAPGERTAQWSSYDRASRYDEATHAYVGWDANGDGGGVIREENGQFVLAEMAGPGVIWRIWSAMPQDGHVRIFLDGAEQPAVDLPFKNFFDGTTAPFTRPALCYDASSGKNCFVPIPYQKSCKIVADPGWGNYYHFTYTTFPKGTRVPTFTRDLKAEDAAALDKANDVLSHPGPIQPTGHTVETIVKDVTVEPGQTVEVAQIKGKRAIALLEMKMDLPPSPADRTILRELSLKMTWDKDAKPSVWTPLGDFFGTAPGANPYRSYPAGLTEDGTWYANWYMPFAKGATIEVTNDGDEARSMQFTIVHEKPFKSPKKLDRFHAKWHRDAFLPGDPVRRAIDWTMLTTIGRGRYCGVALNVWNPLGGWWGEGDEKFFVDGETFPSTIGTGSEDYFGYAWCNPTLFARPFNNQTISENNAGHTSVNRWQIADNIPFQKHFEGYIEKYFPNSRPTLYSCVAYWYLSSGGDDPYGVVPVAERTVWPEPKLVKVEGALEGEKLDIDSITGGNHHVQEMVGFGPDWSDGDQLFWTDAKPGDELDLLLPVETAGKYSIRARMTMARDYGVVQFYLDGKKIGKPVDLYNPDVKPTGEIQLAIQTLSAGSHTLGMKMVGANEKADKAYMVGLDYVRLVPAP